MVLWLFSALVSPGLACCRMRFRSLPFWSGPAFGTLLILSSCADIRPSPFDPFRCYDGDTTTFRFPPFSSSVPPSDGENSKRSPSLLEEPIPCRLIPGFFRLERTNPPGQPLQEMVPTCLFSPTRKERGVISSISHAISAERPPLCHLQLALALYQNHFLL